MVETCIIFVSIHLCLDLYYAFVTVSQLQSSCMYFYPCWDFTYICEILFFPFDTHTHSLWICYIHCYYCCVILIHDILSGCIYGCSWLSFWTILYTACALVQSYFSIFPVRFSKISLWFTVFFPNVSRWKSEAFNHHEDSHLHIILKISIIISYIPVTSIVYAPNSMIIPNRSSFHGMCL